MGSKTPPNDGAVTRLSVISLPQLHSKPSSMILATLPESSWERLVISRLILGIKRNTTAKKNRKDETDFDDAESLTQTSEEIQHNMTSDTIFYLALLIIFIRNSRTYASRDGESAETSIRPNTKDVSLTLGRVAEARHPNKTR